MHGVLKMIRQYK